MKTDIGGWRLGDWEFEIRIKMGIVARQIWFRPPTGEGEKSCGLAIK